MNIKKNTIILSFSFLVAMISMISMTSSTATAHPLNGDIQKTITENVYSVDVNGWSFGSAFAVSDQMLITNYHVVMEDWQEGTYTKVVTIENHNGSYKHQGYVVFVDKENDFALILMNEELPGFIPLGSMDDVVKAQTQVFIAGYPLADRLVLTRGYLQGPSEEENYISLTAQIAPGNSGGPVLYWDKEDERYEVLGVASAKLADSVESYPHLALMRPLDALTAFLSPFQDK